MAKVNGVIPKQVTYVASKFMKEKIPVWDGEKHNLTDMVVSSTAEVIDSKSKALPNVISRHTEVTYGSTCHFPLTSIFCVDNEPLTVRVLENTRYDEKTVTCLVKINDVDLRVLMAKDCLVESLTSVGVSEGGNLNGEFIWMRSGSNTRLTRIGSDEYKLFYEETEARDSLGSALKLSELIPGAFYRTATSVVMYCGATEADDYHVDLKTEGQVHGWRYTYKTVNISDVVHSSRVQQHSWINADEKQFKRSLEYSARYTHVVESKSRRVFKRVGDEIIDLDELFEKIRKESQSDLKYADKAAAGASIQLYEGDFNNHSIPKLANAARGNSTIRKANAIIGMPDIMVKFKEAVTKK